MITDASEARNHAAITIEQEGMAYAVLDYCGGETYIADPQLAKLWSNAAMVLGKLETYLAKNAGEQSELVDRTPDVKRAEAEFMVAIKKQWSD